MTLVPEPEAPNGDEPVSRVVASVQSMTRPRRTTGSELRALPTEGRGLVTRRDGVPDAELVARALGGDRWAHEAIFRRYVEDVLALATRMLGSSSEADDVAQDTFAAAFQRLDRLDQPERLRSWLIGIAVHRVRRRFQARRIRRFVGLGSDEPGLVELASPDSSPETRAELALVDGLLRQLPADERLAWMLHRVEGETLEDVASITGKSLATVKRRISAIDVRLQGLLTRGGEP